MTNEEKQVADWMMAFGQEVPDKPTIPSLEVRKLRAKLILEEALETVIHGLGISEIVDDYGYVCDLEELLKDLNRDGVMFSSSVEPSLTEIADGCADLMVVTLGTKAACGLLRKYHKNDTAYGTDPIFSEVMRSNWTKLWTGEEVECGCEPKGLRAIRVKESDPSGSDYKEFRCWLVMDASGKVIKSPSTEQPNLEQFIK